MVQSRYHDSKSKMRQFLLCMNLWSILRSFDFSMSKFLQFGSLQRQLDKMVIFPQIDRLIDKYDQQVRTKMYNFFSGKGKIDHRVGFIRIIGLYMNRFALSLIYRFSLDLIGWIADWSH